MGLRDMLKKKDGLNEGASGRHAETLDRLNVGPEFTFIRSDTHTQEIIHPPTHPTHPTTGRLAASKEPNIARRSLDVFRSGGRSRSNSASNGGGSTPTKEKENDELKHALQQPADPSSSRRISQRLHLSRSPASSDYVPQNLPSINVVGAGAEAESQWENRATILAQTNEERRKSVSPVPSSPPVLPSLRPQAQRAISNSKATDDELQEAIRLHEEGQLEKSTEAFGRLANPNGANNPLSQVLYGLALRHGWGCEPNPERAIAYLSAAASNAATIENLALQAGMKKGGAAKGELVLAIFELANCFRNGWGIPRDPVAAKQYYETAANLGDSDAMNEIAWCYLEGFGCKKDKYAAARYYRLAEESGNKTLGNSWIWKDKYAPENTGKKK